MTIKDFILREKDEFTMDKVFIVTHKANSFFIKCAIYRHIEKNDRVVLYINNITKYHFDLNTGDFIPTNMALNEPKWYDIDDNGVSITDREGLIKTIRKSIKSFIKNEKCSNKTFKTIFNESKMFGGRISFIKEDMPMMYIGSSSTDEDFYDVFVYKDENNKPKLLYNTIINNKTFVEPKDYDDNINGLINFVNNNRSEIVKLVNENHMDVMINGINFGVDTNHYRKYDKNALSHLISTYKKLFKYGKMADVLMDILDNQVTDFDRNNVLQVLYEVHTDYVKYYRDLDENYKRYYVEYFWEKCNTKFQSKLMLIQNEHLKSYYIGFCETFKRVLLEEACIKNF